MDESQPRQHDQHQPAKQQQQWSRSRLTADGQTSRRPRAVAGQRAAAKRAAGATVIEPTLPDSRKPIEPETIEPGATELESVEPETSDSEDSSSASPTSSTKVRERTRTRRALVSSSRTKSVPSSGTTSTASGTRSARRAIVTAVLAVALIAVVVIGAVFAVQYRNVIRTDHARTAAIAAAERAAPVIFSYDYRHLDQDFSKAEAYLTGAFRGQYEKTTQTVVKPTALQYHGVVRATVAKPADGSAAAVSVVSAAPDQVVVLAFIDQSTTSTRVTGTQVDQNRVLLTLTHTAQGWLVSAVDAL